MRDEPGAHASQHEPNDRLDSNEPVVGKEKGGQDVGVEPVTVCADAEDDQNDSEYADHQLGREAQQVTRRCRDFDLGKADCRHGGAVRAQ